MLLVCFSLVSLVGVSCKCKMLGNLVVNGPLSQSLSAGVSGCGGYLSTSPPVLEKAVT